MGLAARQNAERAKGLPSLSRAPGWKGCGSSEKFLYRLLSKIDRGSLIITNDRGASFHFGRAGEPLRAHIKVHDPRFFDRLVAGASLALGESYVDGWWDELEDRVCDFTGILMANHLELKVREDLRHALKTYLHMLLTNPRSLRTARRCVQSHYDLSNELFSLFLDPTMAYSCGFQEQPGDTLEQMQIQKYDRIARKLNLDGQEAGRRLLDIGCGWGGLLMRLAGRHSGLFCDGVTLSRGQYSLARDRLAGAGMDDRVRVHLKDYRELRGQYDYIVSVGMFEHVGRVGHRAFMTKLRELMKPGGVGLLHTIGLTDPPNVKPDPWIAKYIFPGSRLPRLEEIVSEIQQAGFVVAHVENWKLHYAETLRRWKDNFDRNRERVVALGRPFDERFLRLWNYYLQVCESSFRHSTCQLYQILFTSVESWNLPMQFRF